MTRLPAVKSECVILRFPQNVRSPTQTPSQGGWKADATEPSCDDGSQAHQEADLSTQDTNWLSLAHGFLGMIKQNPILNKTLKLVMFSALCH